MIVFIRSQFLLPLSFKYLLFCYQFIIFVIFKMRFSLSLIGFLFFSEFMIIVYFRCGYTIKTFVYKMKCCFCKHFVTEVYNLPYWIRLVSSCIFNCSPKFLIVFMVCSMQLIMLFFSILSPLLLEANFAFFECVCYCFSSFNDRLLHVSFMLELRFRCCNSC